MPSIEFQPVLSDSWCLIRGPRRLREQLMQLWKVNLTSGSEERQLNWKDVVSAAQSVWYLYILYPWKWIRVTSSYVSKRDRSWFVWSCKILNMILEAGERLKLNCTAHHSVTLSWTSGFVQIHINSCSFGILLSTDQHVQVISGKLSCP